MQHTEVSGEIRHIYIYIYIHVIRRLKVNNASDNAVMMTRPCRKAATLAMARWVILSLQPLLSQGPSLYCARRRATLAQSYLLTKCHVLCSNVRQATRYCFVKDACLLPQNAAIICKLVFFWRFSMLYSNVCAVCRLFALLIEFLHSAGDLSVSARCSPLCVHKLSICNFVTDIGQRLIAPSVTFGCYVSPKVALYDVPTVYQAREIRTYHKIRHSLSNSTLLWHTQSQFHNSLFYLSYQWLGQHQSSCLHRASTVSKHFCVIPNWCTQL